MLKIKQVLKHFAGLDPQYKGYGVAGELCNLKGEGQMFLGKLFCFAFVVSAAGF